MVIDLLDPSRSAARGVAIMGLLLFGSAWLFFGVLEDVVSGDPLVRADAGIYRALQDLRTAPGDAVMIAITELGDTFVVIAMAATVFLWLAWRRAWRTAAYWLLAIAGASALNTAIKVALHRARPGELYTGWSAFSFPSGHSTVNIVLYGFLAFVVGNELRPSLRLPAAITAISLVVLIAFSRLYLGAHWLSDVIGGLAFGMAWLIAIGLSFMRKRTETVGAAGLLAVSAATLALAGGLNIFLHQTPDVERYTVQHAVPTMTAGDWWETGWSQLPSRRVDLTGEIQEPLTVQWAGDLSAIRQALLDKGWRQPSPWTLSNTLGWFASTASPSEHPVIPRLASGRFPSLTLVRPDTTKPDDARLVFQLWTVDVDLINATSPSIWIGSVVEERFSRPLRLVTLASTQPDANAPRDMLARGMQSFRMVRRSEAAEDANWDGRVLLLGERK